MKATITIGKLVIKIEDDETEDIQPTITYTDETQPEPEKKVPAPGIGNGNGALHALSVREQRILEFLTLGMSNKEIANKLVICESTTKVHMKSILRKLGLKNRTQAAMWAQR